MTVPRVFLSYARADGPAVRVFADTLRAEGLGVSLDVDSSDRPSFPYCSAR